jgi:hypothetical protein
MCLVVERLLACSKRMQSATVFPSAAAAWSPACGSCSSCMVDPRRCASSRGRGAGVSAKPAAQHVQCICSADPSSRCQAAQHMNYFTASSLSTDLRKAEWFAVGRFQLRASQVADTSCEAPVNRAAVPGLGHCRPCITLMACRGVAGAASSAGDARSGKAETCATAAGYAQKGTWWTVATSCSRRRNSLSSCVLSRRASVTVVMSFVCKSADRDSRPSHALLCQWCG